VLIKPLIGRVEGREAEIDDAEPTDSPVPAQGLDQNGAERTDRDHIAIQLHMPLAFKDYINLRVKPMVVHLRILLDIHDVDRGRVVVGQCERPPGGSAGTLHRLNVIEMSDDIVGHDIFLQEPGQQPSPDTTPSFPRTQESILSWHVEAASRMLYILSQHRFRDKRSRATAFA